VISDIHGNADALAAVLADMDAQGIDRIVNLGDHLSGPLAPVETLDLLRARPGMICIRGNHDRWLLERAPDEMGPSDRVTFDQLGPADLDWLRALPATVRLGDVLLCHATPADDLTYWLHQVTPEGAVLRRPQAGVAALLGNEAAPLILCGHTHLPRAVRLGGVLIVNPGSVGLPGYEAGMPVPHVIETGLPDASYATVEHGPAGWRVSFRQVPYDPARMAAMARRHGQEDWARALETGWLG
jgi:putative phosphoesterase